MKERLPDFAIVTDASPQGIRALFATVDHNVGQTFTILERLEIPVLEEDANCSECREVGFPSLGNQVGRQACDPSQRQRGGLSYGTAAIFSIPSDQLDRG